MRILLRIIAAIVGIAVLLTLLMVVQFAFSGGLTALLHSGAFGMTTLAGWLVILTAGPLASAQLWRLRRVGLYLTTFLCAAAWLTT